MNISHLDLYQNQKKVKYISVENTTDMNKNMNVANSPICAILAILKVIKKFIRILFSSNNLRGGKIRL